MPSRYRQRIPPTDEWQQLELLLDTPGQRSYEVIRPVLLFGEPVPERATATQTHARTVYRTVARFEAEGLRGLEPPPKLERHQRLPAEVRQAILDLRREHPPLHLREISTICSVRLGHRPSPMTVRRILAEAPALPRASRRFPPYHAIADSFQRRRAVLQLHFEGWNRASIAAYLEVSRHTVDDVLRRWVADDLAGLHDKSRRPHRLATKQTLAAIHTIKTLQQNPALGEFRVHVALKQLGIDLSPRTCRRILALNRKLYGLPLPAKAPREPKPMPFAAQYRHLVWSVDLRYLDHRLEDFKVYCLTILDNYSRAVLASEVSLTQDLGVYLCVLRQALDRWGVPTMLVSAAELERAFAPVQLPGRVDRSGYVRFRRWWLYGERGLAHKMVAVWLTQERLVLTYSDEPLAQYAVTYARDRRHLRTVREERLFVTPFQSPQPPLWEPVDGEWLRVLRLPAPLPRRPRRAVGEQPPLFALAD